jgi:PEP-CTERM motif
MLDNSVMLTTNKLTKILSGVATLGIATAIAAPAQAVHFTVPLDANGNGFINVDIDGIFYDSVILGDKSFYNFSIDGDVGEGDELRFVLNQGVWTLEFAEQTSLGVADGQLHYEVHILDPDKTFDDVEFDTDVAGPPGNTNYFATKEIFTLDDLENPVVTLESINGSEDFDSILGLTTIKVVDTFTSGDGGISLLESSTNDFTQTTPEPGTILGLLAVGGLGMVSRFKKQK